jgi:DNA-binding transcriptional LysR family regulator
MSSVELRHLDALAAVVDEGSFGRAAARLGYTQSTVSQQIAALEKAVGGAVFDRPGGPRPVRLTPLGAVVLRHGRDVLDRAGMLAAAVDRFRAGEGRIDIGTFQSVSATLLPPVIRRLREAYPGCDIRLVEEETDTPRVDEHDLTFTDVRAGGDVEHRKLLDDPYVLVTRRGDRPAGPVRTAGLDGATLVAHPPICDQARMEQALARDRIRPRVVFRTPGNDAVLAMVRAGMGAALLPRLAVHGVRGDPSLRVHELRPAPPPREIFVAWPAGRTQSPLAARVVGIAVAVAREFTPRRR